MRICELGLRSEGQQGKSRVAGKSQAIDLADTQPHAQVTKTGNLRRSAIHSRPALRLPFGVLARPLLWLQK